MNKKEAKEKLQLHSDFITENEDSFLYSLKQKFKINKNNFFEIMEIIKCLAEDCFYKKIDGEVIKNIYTIIFWCRSWLGEGALLDINLNLDEKKLLLKYTEIIEETLYYLLNGEIEEAFWIYNEYLDGRY